jgi:hypothetical protein
MDEKVGVVFLADKNSDLRHWSDLLRMASIDGHAFSPHWFFNAAGRAPRNKHHRPVFVSDGDSALTPAPPRAKINSALILPVRELSDLFPMEHRI